jgi:hypothetical protein
MTEPNFETVLIDTHNYQVFDNTQNAWDWPTHLRVSPYTATGADSSKSANEATLTGTRLYGRSSESGHWPTPTVLNT